MLRYVIWGDPETLNEVDVERFRWPSIAKDCVWGVIHFLRAIPFQHGFMSYPGGDLQLLADVLALPNVHSVDIIQGTKDAIIPPSNGRRLAKFFPTIRIEELEGIGHAPFEEAPNLFMETVRKMLLEN
jgi:pimeloyl-ACP methyl ester carboxylesterase